jgi:hypothetical protein
MSAATAADPRIDRARAIKDAEEAEKLADAQEEAAGLLIACGCCYGEAPFRKMVQCAEVHPRTVCAGSANLRV